MERPQEDGLFMWMITEVVFMITVTTSPEKND